MCVCVYLNEIAVNGCEGGGGGGVLVNGQEKYRYALSCLFLQTQLLRELVDQITNCRVNNPMSVCMCVRGGSAHMLMGST